jgi:hypothetical protein
VSIINVFVIGLIATAYMFGFQWFVQRLGIVRGGMVETIGTFLIPEEMRSRVAAVVLHVVMGVVFAGGYGYIFTFTHLESFGRMVAIGGLIGFVHGFFLSYFMVMGFSSYQGGADVRTFTLASSVLCVVDHLLYRVMVGLGFAVAAKQGTIVWFASYSICLGAVVGALGFMLLKPAAKRRRLAGRGI